MSNKHSYITDMKNMENAGWSKVRQQLDIELPIRRKDNRLFWIFLLAGLGISSTWLFNLDKFKNETLEIKNEFTTHQPSILPGNSELNEQTSSSKSKEEIIKGSPEISLNARSSIRKTRLNSKVNVGASNTDLVLNNTESDLSSVRSPKGLFSKDEKKSTLQSKSGREAISNSVAVAEPSSTASDQEVESAIFKEQNMFFYISAIDNILTPLVYGGDRLNQKIVDLTFAANFQPILINNPSQKLEPLSNLLLQVGSAYQFNKNGLSSHYIPNANLGYRLSISNRFYGIGKLGLNYMMMRNSKSFSSIGQVTNDPSLAISKNNLDITNSSSSLGTIKGIVFESNRNIASIRNDTLLLGPNDQLIVKDNNQMYFHIGLALGYRVSNKFFLESGLELRNSFSTRRAAILFESNQGFANATPSFQSYTYNYQKSKNQYLLGLNAGYQLSNKISILGGLNFPIHASQNRSANYDKSPSASPGSIISSPVLLSSIKSSTSLNMALRFDF
ncbi:MAG: hypothetical protein ABI844_03250 [Saprospiraceae bacterium]